MTTLKEISVTNLRRSLKNVLATNETAMAVTNKGIDVAVIMSPKHYKKMLSLLKFANAITDR